MERGFMYPGQIPLTETALNGFKYPMIDGAMLAETVLGQGAWAYGLACTALSNTAVSGSAFAVQIGRGCIYSYQETDPNPYGILSTDTATNILKKGVNLGTTNVPLANAAPATVGYSINYLISAAFQEADTNAVVLPYVNASNPSVPWAGPTNSGAAQNLLRSQTVVLTSTSGTAAPTGTQTTPAAPSGAVPLWVVTVHYGDSAVVSGQISTSPLSPIIDAAGVGRGIQSGRKLATKIFTATGSYTPDPGTRFIRVRACGGGGGSGGTSTTSSTQISVTAGANGGCQVEGEYTVTPGVALAVTVGAGGVAGAAGSSGGTGGTTSLGSLFSAPGGHGSSGGGAYTPPYGAAPPTPGTVNQATGGTVMNGWETPGTGAFGFGLGNYFTGPGGNGIDGGGGDWAGAGLGYGAGAGGTSIGASTNGAVGQPGAGGIVIIEQFT